MRPLGEIGNHGNHQGRNTRRLLSPVFAGLQPDHLPEVDVRPAVQNLRRKELWHESTLQSGECRAEAANLGQAGVGAAFRKSVQPDKVEGKRQVQPTLSQDGHLRQKRFYKHQPNVRRFPKRHFDVERFLRQSDGSEVFDQSQQDLVRLRGGRWRQRRPLHRVQPGHHSGGDLSLPKNGCSVDQRLNRFIKSALWHLSSYLKQF